MLQNQQGVIKLLSRLVSLLWTVLNYNSWLTLAVDNDRDSNLTFFDENVLFQNRSQSRSQSMPVRGLGSGMTLGKSNRNRDLIGCRDHQCCRHINACFFARITREHTRRENYQCLSDLECEIKQYKSKDIIILIVWTSIGTLGIYLQNGIVFMNDFLSIYSILTYLYVETTAYKFLIYSMITMRHERIG